MTIQTTLELTSSGFVILKINNIGEFVMGHIDQNMYGTWTITVNGRKLPQVEPNRE